MNTALPSIQETDALVLESNSSELKLEEEADGWWLELNIDVEDLTQQNRKIITTKTLGEAMISKAIYENQDETPYTLVIDYYGEETKNKKPLPGPFSNLNNQSIRFLVWPR